MYVCTTAQTSERRCLRGSSWPLPRRDTSCRVGGLGPCQCGSRSAPPASTVPWSPLLVALTSPLSGVSSSDSSLEEEASAWACPFCSPSSSSLSLTPSFLFSSRLSAVAHVSSCSLCASLSGSSHTAITCDPPPARKAGWAPAPSAEDVADGCSLLSCPRFPLPLCCPVLPCSRWATASQAPSSLFQPKPSSGGRRRGGQRHKVKSQGACMPPASGC